MRTGIGAVVVLAALVAVTPAALAHQGNPNYLSQVDAITPATRGVTVEVLNRDDRLLLTNKSGRVILIEDYEGAPYARLLADGRVQVNTDSKAYYVNNDRLGDVAVPTGVDGKGSPQWKQLSGTGRFEWHDHRAHWMGTQRPPQVKDPSVKTKVFNWRVPVKVGGSRGAIAGTLFWTPLPGGGPPPGALIALALLVVASVATVVVVRRRRRAPDGAAESPEPMEAW